MHVLRTLARTGGVFALTAMMLRPCMGQSPLANLGGKIMDQQTSQPLRGAVVQLESEGGASRLAIITSAEDGRFLIPLQIPGAYRLRITAAGYQPNLISEVDLRTGALVELEILLRPAADILSRGRFRTWIPQGGREVLVTPGPDFSSGDSMGLSRQSLRSAALTPTISESIGPLWLRELPLAGRDAYAMLVFLPGVSSDSSTSRGLGFTPNGQRPSSTHFLLDGQENDDSTLTGPRILLPPEAVGEYRAAVGNFSAEFGGTTGLVANAITNSGTESWHGRIYGYLRNDILNANDFQQNRLGIRRAPFKELHLGGNWGGPLLPNRLFVFGSLERFRSRRRMSPEAVELPTQAYSFYSAPNSFARSILDRFGAGVILPVGRSFLPTGTVDIAKPYSLNNTVALLRIDHNPQAASLHTFLRLMGSRQDRPDFIWSPYPGFGSTLFQTAGSALVGATARLDQDATLEVRGSYAIDDTLWDRPHPEVPTLSAGNTLLPGSPAFYAYRNRNMTWQLSNSLLISRGAHLIKLGLAGLHRRQASLLTAGRDGLLVYPSFIDFGADWPLQLQVSAPRAGGAAEPAFGRGYRLTQWSGYAQDDWRIREGTSIYLGVRYEYFGVPSAATPETVIDGLSFGTARFKTSQAPLFQPDRNNFAFRTGLSQRFGQSSTVLRAGSGVFFDRGFDNLWQTIRSNGLILQALPFNVPSNQLKQPVRNILALSNRQAISLAFPEGVLIQSDLRSPYTWSQFATVETGLSRSTSVTMGVQSSLGRKLITTDRINRLFSEASTFDNPLGLLNPAMPTVAYRGNQGLSSYWAFQAGIRHSAGSTAVAIQYTWSHNIDTQSEPLAGDFFDLNFARAQSGTGRDTTAAFSRQFRPRDDRGSSSFDQRHVLSAVATAPLIKGFRAAGSFSIRSGLPYTVFTKGSTAFDKETIYGRRPDLSSVLTTYSQLAVEGGKRILDPDAFAEPAEGVQGNVGRNSLREPGFVGLDASISRAFQVWKGSARAPRLILRADAFNLLNHTNLGTPERSLASDDFGVSKYGRVGRSSGFPGLTPFSESPRQVQVMLRLEF